MDYEKLVLIVEKAKAGDKDALVELYKGMYNRVYFYAFKMFGNESDAADVVEEVFVKVFTKLDTLEDPKAFPKWLYIITVNECNQKIRTDKRMILLEESEELFEKLVTSDDDDLSLEIERKDMKSFLMSIIDLLPEEQKRAILLYYYNELTIALIAEIEQVAEGTIKTRLSLARKKLKKACDAEEKRTGVKLYSFGAPALSSVLNQASMMNPMPLDLAVGALVAALAAAGYVGAESVRLLTTNETEAKGFFNKMKQGVIIEVKPYKLLLVAAVIVALVVGGFAVSSFRNTPANVSGEFLPVKYVEGDYFEMALADLPESVKGNAAYYAYGWYNKQLDDVTPEMAFMRTVGGEDMCFEIGKYYPVEEKTTGMWPMDRTNVIGLFDLDHNLLAYAYGYTEKKVDTPPDVINLIYIDDFEPIDRDALLEKADSVITDRLASVPRLDASAFCFRVRSLGDEEILDIDYESDAFKSSGLSKSDVMYYNKCWFDTDEEEPVMMLIKTYSAIYWQDESHFIGPDQYNKLGRGLGRATEGHYLGDFDNDNIHVVILFNQDCNISAYAYMHRDEIVKQ